MPEDIPGPRQGARDQGELYEKSGGAGDTAFRDTGLPVIDLRADHRGVGWSGGRAEPGATVATPVSLVEG